MAATLSIAPMSAAPVRMSTAGVAPRDRLPLWRDWMRRLFDGLDSDAYGDTAFDGETATLQAGDVVLTRLAASRHRVQRVTAASADRSRAYLKIVAPWRGSAGVVQHGREAWVRPGQWSVYDTTLRYRVENPEQVEHLIVMVPRERVLHGLPGLVGQLARPLGGQGGIARVALATLRSAFEELPHTAPAQAARLGEQLAELVRLSLLEDAGVATDAGRHAALRERIRRHVAEHFADPDLDVAAIARALGCSPRALYRAFDGEGEGIAALVAEHRLIAARDALAADPQRRRTITDIALDAGFSNMAHFSRAFRARFGLTPSDWRVRAAG